MYLNYQQKISYCDNFVTMMRLFIECPSYIHRHSKGELVLTILGQGETKYGQIDS